MSKRERQTREIIYIWTIVILAASTGILFAALSGCAQVQEKTFIASCTKDYPPLPGQLSPGTVMVIDASTSPVPLISAPHRIIEQCDANGNMEPLKIETPVDTGFSQFSTPLSAVASHVTYAP